MLLTFPKVDRISMNDEILRNSLVKCCYNTTTVTYRDTAYKFPVWELKYLLPSLVLKRDYRVEEVFSLCFDGKRTLAKG